MTQELIQSSKILITEGDFSSAKEILLPLAESGNAEAQYLLGSFVLEGDREMTGTEALEWLRSSAVQNYPPALYELCGFQVEEDGRISTGGPSDEDGRKMLRQAAEFGYALAQQSLGALLCTGDCGFEKDERKGREWYRAAVEQDHTDAYYDYASMLLEGEGGESDRDTAMRILHEGVDRSDFDCADFLHEIYAEGLFGVEKNLEDARRFGKLAQKIESDETRVFPGSDELLTLNEELRPVLTKIEEAAGEEFAKEFIELFMRSCFGDEKLEEEIEHLFQDLSDNMTQKDSMELSALFEKAFESLEE